MSTAATQSPGHHTAVISSNYPNSASSSRQYVTHSSPNNLPDESYYTSHDAYAASTNSQRSAQSRRGQPQATYNMNDDQAHYSRTNPAVTLPIHSRTQSNVAADQYDGGPFVPPRTTSQHAHSASTAAASSRSTRTDAQNAQRYPTVDYADDARDKPRDDNVTATRSRRRGPHSPEGPQRAASTRERGYEQDLSSSTRSAAQIHQQPQPPPMMRENSEVLNRLVISDPLVDEERMRARIAEAQPLQPTDAARQAGLTTGEIYDNEARGPQRRQDYSKSKRREIQFGDYVLGQTLGEGEFGKVKLGWKKDGSSQVAIKLIRRESVATNPTRLPKIYREISILKELAHPNIVRLHEMVETERHIGIILEYASGGELFDYILNQRYLKDPSARRLFAQLVSGVGYLHKKGIVHRDLKLENLLLDQNKNIIITDFGFANTFNPVDELSAEIEYNLGNKDFVRKWKLDQMDRNGMRKGDLMQTSCGSPCYAAPELVVSDSLYTGRKVDVWSCGVILYAMLAGYLPFDDDPANPEGDNINLLYKYITSTPLTFPEYVTPHARDLLRRILVPDPRKRADLFEVARHSWLTEYHHVVAHITSSTTNIADIVNSTVTTGEDETATVNRSVSVRVPPSSSPSQAAQQAAVAQPSAREDQKRVTTRHTLQAEYVPPQQHTERTTTTEKADRTRPDPDYPTVSQATLQKPLPSAPVDQQTTDYSYVKPQNVHQATTIAPSRDMPPPVTTAMNVSTGTAQSNQYVTRPSTQGSVGSAGPTRSDLRLPSRGSYGQPVAPSVATTTAQGKVTQPQKSGRGYNISGPQYQHGASNSIGQQMSPSMATPPPPSTSPAQSAQPSQKGHHRRSSTLSSLGEKLFGRSNSVIRKDRDEKQKNGRKYPPTSMKNPYPEEPQPRLSSDSKRSFSFGLRRKQSQDPEPSQVEEKPRRLSFLPQSSSLKGIFGGHKETPENAQVFGNDQQPGRPNTTDNRFPQYNYDGQQDRRQHNFSRPPQSQGGYGHRPQPSANDVYGSTGVYSDNQQRNPSYSQSQHRRGDSQPQFSHYADSFTNQSRPSMTQSRNTLQKPRKDFNSGYDDHGRGGAVKRVQDFFRRRGRARADPQFT